MIWRKLGPHRNVFMHHMKILVFSLLALAMAAVAPGFAADSKPATKPARGPDPSLAPVEDVPGLPRVLLIGDSISMGYTLPVREMLKGKANVHRIPVNGGPTSRAVPYLARWLGDTKWDVIHFNWGLHDIKWVGEANAPVEVNAPGGHRQVSPEDYEKNLTTMVAQLKTTGAKLIWCNTTPAPEGSSGRVAGDEVKYNEIAAKVMSAAGIPTDDLWSHAHAKIAEVQMPKNVHYTPAGYKYLAEKVSREIEKALPK
ncbi:MAG: lipolytic protein family [Verrucomicrobiaceae bacterium]|nr:lipolytic protein family [Verrucomicrobiaceae bacterium]